MFQWVKSGWSAVKNALRKTRSTLTTRIRALFGNGIDESLLEQLEEVLYEADLGVQITQDLVSHVRKQLKKNPTMDVDTLLGILETALVQELASIPARSHATTSPTIILVVGANGSGKTTSIAKLAKSFMDQKKSVLLAAADTFRAAAQEQLSVWAERLAVPIVRANYQADPAAVAYDAISSAKAKNIDIVIIDTAGRLENKQHLLKELEKIKKSCAKACESAPHEILMVLDATIGQNGIEQVRSFHEAIGVTGLILTKLDGSAKGGIVIAIQRQLGLPVQFIGTGETIDALTPFEPTPFVHAMFFDE